jgi:hydrogenase maturation protease
MSKPTILIAGIGNIFLGDDAFGVEVAQRLLREPWPPEIRVLDAGIRGLDLVYRLLDGWDAVILIDAIQRGDGPPGTLYLLEPELDADNPADSQIEAHSMDPARVLRTARSMGAQMRQVFIVGCEPSPLDEHDDGLTPLAPSPPVTAAIEPAIQMIHSLVQRIRGTPPAENHSKERLAI